MEEDVKALVCPCCLKPIFLGQLATLRKFDFGTVFVHRDCLNAPLPEQEEEQKENSAQE